MITITFRKEPHAGLRLLCLGAHSDDIELGCGGTVLRLLDEIPGAEVDWVVFGATGERRNEALASADRFLAKAARKNVVIHGFRDGFFPYVGGEIKDVFEGLKSRCNPDVVFTTFRGDLHQDHRLVSELTWNTFRDHLILEYEVVKYDGDLGAPGAFVHLSESMAREKVKNILECFKTQHEKRWFTEDTFFSMLRLRGVESNAPGKYAEAFYCRKIVF